MKVKCIDIIDHETGKSIQTSPWLTIGNLYHVLSVFIAENHLPEYRLVSDDGYTPGLFKANQFKVSSEVLPSNWIVNYKIGSYFELAPKSWSEEGFWEAYFDGESSAVKKYEDEKKVVFQYD